MLPSVLAKQYQEGLMDYIDTTFPITNPIFKDSIKNMLHTKDAVFHEPYVSVRLPFRVYEDDREFFESIHLSFPPYVHQQKAWERLTGNYGRSTLVATGTGSGKTECFLYPILEYCYKHSGEPGIKALIIYPMNALAADQAKRIAEIVDSSKELKVAQVRVGMYVGGEESGATTMMTSDKVITKKDIMIASPPDILLTNYKMLDYLLVRPKDAELWNKNLPDTLKYIAVDELHTFDGAQGTDLACLLRRLKTRLNVEPGHICCVGTSATMGSKDSAGNIRQYAADVFGEVFDEESVITEDRLSSEEFFRNADVIDYKMPTSSEARRLAELAQGEDEQTYLEAAVRAWFDESFMFTDVMSDDCRVDIADRLMHHNFTHSLISEAAGNYMQSSFVVEHLSKRFPLLVNYGEELAATVIDALYALVSHARTRTESGKIRPFLNVQVQLWMRELRRLVGKVADKDISYALFSDLNDDQAKHYLPVINCRECGETGWVSIEEDGSVQLRDMGTFYNLFFNGDSKIKMMFPYDKADKEVPITNRYRLCPTCMDISYDEGHELCPNGHKTIPVWIPDVKVEGKRNTKQYLCPHCGNKSKLSIIGMRSATEVSAGISELYASKFNDDKKLLAFTDNVQDAAHHAGFYNARTWKFGLRTAVTRFANMQEEEYTLDDFLKRMIAYWRGILGNEAYVSYFIPEGMKWMRAYKDMCEKGALGGDEDTERLLSYVDQRTKYETLLEYGILSRVGRSLEKAGCSVVSFNFENALSRIKERVANEVGKLQDADINVFRQMVMGMLYELKNNGGYSYYTYDSFIEAGGNAYMISNKRMKWMPGEHKGRNVPKYIAINRGNKKLGYFDQVDDRSWYGRWIYKYLPDFSLESDPRDIARIILEELTNDGVLIKTTTSDDVDVWQINSEKCIVSRSVKQLVCDKCGCQMSASADNAEGFDGAFCVRKECDGHMHIKEDSELDFYGKLYSQGEMIRIVAKEHTGLLEREDRENLERSFKQSKENKKPWDANLLSCTPTLEMGIDIGDLSTVILSSIPPAQAQYAQRAGRGGRKDGNSLTVAVANAKPHDLYFYQDPMEMISGEVQPPKVFLKASAVLERQFVAFCMDSWVKSGEASIPENVGACLAKLGETGTDRFPNNFLTYVQTNMEHLVKGFIKAFEEGEDGVGGLDDICIDNIRDFAKDRFATKINNEFHSLKKQRSAIQESIKELRKMIKDLEAKPEDASYDEQLKELYAEVAAWSSVVRKINQKDVFGFLSDSGLLPNYAFPEAGIVLKAVLTRVDKDPEQEGKNKYESTTYEYSRSASAAISEFAPLNSFYAGGHRLNIDQVDVNTAEVEPWRLCPNCSHSEKADSTQNVTICPKCGSTGWADAGQVRSMFRVQMVYSNMKEEDSLIGDESDDRAKTFYDKELLVEVDEDKDVIQAFEMDNDEFKFGYEFLQKATMREINFGEQDIVGDKLSVAGKEGIRKGFSICKYCGKIQTSENRIKHTRFCKMVKDPQAALDAYEECLFLYRDFQTEALRLLIPATTMDSSSKRVESFVAAFMLGMKSYFGNVDHLNATVSEVPVPDAAYRKQYLVIYDSVPGGTGYLKQLMNDENGIVDILQRALDVMTSCTCNETEGKDGCYKCLFAYRQSSHIGEISRDTAVNLLRAILSGKDNKKPIKKLAEVDSNPLFDSELERMFVGAFEKLSTSERPIVTHPTWLGDKQGYTLQVGNSLWEIEPQVHLGAQDGVVIDSKPDFILRAKRTTGNQKEVAVFTDGFTFHKDKVEDDTKKRMAISLAGKYRVWSLSYKDVQDVYKDLGEYKTETLTPEKMPSGTKIYRPAVKSAGAEAIRPDKENAFELLVDYLAMPDAEKIFTAHASAYAMSIVDMTLMGNQMSYDSWKNKWNEVLSAVESPDEVDPFGQAIFGTWNPRQSMGNISVMSETSIADMTVQKMNAPARVGIVLNDDTASRSDKYEEDWNGFWHFVNVLQFADTLYYLSRVGIEKAEYTAIGSIIAKPDIQTSAPSQPDVVIDSRWSDIMDDFFDDIARVCATEMMNNGIVAPDVVCFELTEDGSEAGIAEAEMAWTELKIVWLLPEQEDYADVFKNHGWRVLLSNEEIDIKAFGGNEDE